MIRANHLADKVLGASDSGVKPAEAVSRSHEQPTFVSVPSSPHHAVPPQLKEGPPKPPGELPTPRKGGETGVPQADDTSDVTTSPTVQVLPSDITHVTKLNSAKGIVPEDVEMCVDQSCTCPLTVLNCLHEDLKGYPSWPR